MEKSLRIRGASSKLAPAAFFLNSSSPLRDTLKWLSTEATSRWG